MSHIQIQNWDELPAVLRIGDLQRLLDISRSTAYALIHQEGFPLLRLGTTGKAMRISREALKIWMANGGRPNA